MPKQLLRFLGSHFLGSRFLGLFGYSCSSTLLSSLNSAITGGLSGSFTTKFLTELLNPTGRINNLLRTRKEGV